VLGRRVPEVAEADVVQQRGRLEAGDVAAQLRGFLVGAQDDRHRVPADGGTNFMLDVADTRRALFLIDRNGVAVSSGQRRRDVDAFAAGGLHQLIDQKVGAFRALVLFHGF
jgi:hypothetical protein